MRRRVIELDQGAIVRDQARGVYGIDAHDGDQSRPEPAARGQRYVPLSADYVARETATNLWRNRLMTIAAVLTVAVSLALVGAALLPQAGRGQRRGRAGSAAPRSTVWMKPDRQPLRDRRPSRPSCNQLPYVHACSFHTQAQDYDEAKTAPHRPTVCSALSEPDDTRPRSAARPPAPGRPARRSTASTASPACYDVTAPHPADPHDGGDDHRPAVGVHRPGARAPALRGGPHPEHHPHGHLRPAPRGVGDEARRGDELVHPPPVHVRGADPGAHRLAAGGRASCSASTSSLNSLGQPEPDRRRAHPDAPVGLGACSAPTPWWSSSAC